MNDCHGIGVAFGVGTGDAVAVASAFGVATAVGVAAGVGLGDGEALAAGEADAGARLTSASVDGLGVAESAPHAAAMTATTNRASMPRWRITIRSLHPPSASLRWVRSGECAMAAVAALGGRFVASAHEGGGLRTKPVEA